MHRDQINELIERALREDIGDGDITTGAIVSPEMTLTGRFVAKESGVVAGLEVVRMTYAAVDERIRFAPWVADGGWAVTGQVLATVRGPGHGLLAAERVALNFLQRMSGIATMTRRFVDAVRATKAVILDTRKTAPGLRLPDKWAVRLGGGENHRMGLHDMVLIKDNHISVAGGITEAVRRVRRAALPHRKIEVEVRNIRELEEALQLNVDRLLLDNMTVDELKEAVRTANGRVPLEASGNITIDNVAAVAATGVDYISVGAVTHSARALDISLSVEPSP